MIKLLDIGWGKCPGDGSRPLTYTTYVKLVLSHNKVWVGELAHRMGAPYNHYTHQHTIATPMLECGEEDAADQVGRGATGAPTRRG